MNYIQLLATALFLNFNVALLYAGSDSEDEEVVTIPSTQPIKSVYERTIESLTEQFGEGLAQQVLPKRYDVIENTVNTWGYNRAPHLFDILVILSKMSTKVIEYGLKTLLPNSSFRHAFCHFSALKEMMPLSAENVDSFLRAAEKIQFYQAQNLTRVAEIISEIEGFSPKSTVILWDLHGTLTKVSTPRSGEVNAEARQLAPQLIKDMAEAGVNNIIVSAWDNVDEVVAQTQYLGLSDVFEIPKEYTLTKGQMDINGTMVSYARVGKVISVKINPKDTYYKDKIYALGFLVDSFSTVVLVDDSSDNLSKAALHFPNIKASEVVDKFHLISLQSVHENEPAVLSETALQKWRAALNLKE